MGIVVITNVDGNESTISFDVDSEARFDKVGTRWLFRVINERTGRITYEKLGRDVKSVVISYLHKEVV